MKTHEPIRPWHRSAGALKVRQKGRPVKGMIPFNTDHSQGRLMYGDPVNHSLGVIGWSNKGP